MEKEGVPFSPAQTAATLDLNMLIPLVSSEFIIIV
jgi:hypothetical protein